MYFDVDGVPYWEKEIGTEKMSKKCKVIQAENGFVVIIKEYQRTDDYSLSNNNESCKIFITDINPLAPIEGQGRSEDKTLVDQSNRILQALEKSMLTI